ncbi:MAG: nickel-dependent hydrogenase large subunit [Nitrospirae bacterium]|nr:nickel-dependent hydrogenase large subunit [Nitrospirota bacterium]
MARLVIDPITRIEGHLKLDVEIEGGKVKDAWTSGTLFRGFELILKGRDPRDAWQITQRVCGVCPTSHAHTSTMGLEDSFKVTPPENAVILRNLIEGCQFLHSHILWFYHLNALDYVDVVSALSAKTTDPALVAVQGKLKTFVDSGQLGPFANAYWGHPAYKLPPEVNLLAVSHYLQALEMQAEAAAASAVWGGRMPMTMTSPPGGVNCMVDLDLIAQFLFRLKKVQAFIDNVMVPDTLAIAPFYLDWAGIGKGHANFLSWGVFTDPKSRDPYKSLLPRGAVYASEGLTAQKVGPEMVTEDTTRGWYKDGPAVNPAQGVTDPEYTSYDTNAKYTWAKSPRLNGKPMEVGALARMLVAYTSGQPTAQSLINGTLTALGVGGKPEVLLSVLGRIAARTLEAKMVADEMIGWTTALAANLGAGNSKLFEQYEIPDKSSGIGLWEAPRGALGHWNEIDGHVLKNYQMVVPTTWNVCPRDEKGVRGPIEEALIGTPVHDAKQPLEILRVVHSFDPCLACTVHVIDPDTNEVRKFRVS